MAGNDPAIVLTVCLSLYLNSEYNLYTVIVNTPVVNSQCSLHILLTVSIVSLGVPFPYVIVSE